MKSFRRRFLKALFGTTAGATLPQFMPKATAASPFPSQAVRIVVASTPGTVMDISGRVVGKYLEPEWQHPIVVLNQPGAGGAIGTDSVAKAKPDGHTLVVAHEGVMAVQPILLHKARSPRSDVRSVTLLTEIDLLLVVTKRRGIRTLSEFLDAATKSNPRLTYASAGNGTPVHLRTEMFKERAGIDLVHVPYKSTAVGMNDLVGGHVDCMLVGIGPALSHIQADKLEVLATAGANRSPLLPNVPTLSETFPGFSFSTWFGLFAPAETPKDIVDRISADVTKALQAESVRKPLLAQGVNPVGGTPEKLDELVKSDFASYARLINSGKLKL